MRRKLIIGLILFAVGILLQVASDVFDIWIIGVLGGIVWPAGMVMGVNASIYLDNEKQNNNPSHLSAEQKRKRKKIDENNN